MASFFLLSVTTQAQENWLNQLSTKELQQLQSLFHMQNGKPKITDSDFMLLGTEASFSEEVTLNFSEFIDEQRRPSYLCQFPARSLWFANKLVMDKPSFSDCEELNSYLESVPADNISLIYASENIISPSSFMGHSFLKLKSEDDSITHAVSYFTNVKGFNLPKIMFESLVTGKEGYFIISPYEEAKEYYKDIEGRNVYEYNLSLTDFEKELIRLHLWELKNKEIDYYFHKNNCATLTLDILAIAEPKLVEHSKEWLSPLDIIKYVNDSTLMESVQVSPAIGWKVRAFGEKFSYQQRLELLANVQAGKIQAHDLPLADQKTTSDLRLEYQEALTDWLYSKGDLDDGTYEVNSRKIVAERRELGDYNLDLSQYKNPVLRSPDSQLSIGVSRQKNEKKLLLSWLPASHSLMDNNSNAFSESSLEVLKSTVSVDGDRISLHELTLYGIESYIPYDSIIGGWSGKFKLGWERGGYESYRNNERFNLSAALGVATDLHPAMLTYITLGSDISADSQALWAVPQLEVGAFMYLANASKMQIKYRFNFNEMNDAAWLHGAEITNSYYFSDGFAIDIGFARYHSDHVNESQISLNYRKYY